MTGNLFNFIYVLQKDRASLELSRVFTMNRKRSSVSQIEVSFSCEWKRALNVSKINLSEAQIDDLQFASFLLI